MNELARPTKQSTPKRGDLMVSFQRLRRIHRVVGFRAVLSHGHSGIRRAFAATSGVGRRSRAMDHDARTSSAPGAMSRRTTTPSTSSTSSGCAAIRPPAPPSTSSGMSSTSAWRFPTRRSKRRRKSGAMSDRGRVYIVLGAATNMGGAMRQTNAQRGVAPSGSTGIPPAAVRWACATSGSGSTRTRGSTTWEGSRWSSSRTRPRAQAPRPATNRLRSGRDGGHSESDRESRDDHGAGLGCRPAG